jgi:hypothetical protein
VGVASVGVGARDDGEAKFHAGTDLFECGWGWGPREEVEEGDIIDDS